MADQSGAEKAAANAQGLLTRQEELKKELSGIQNAGADREKLLAKYKTSQEKGNRLAELAGKIKTLKEDEKSLEKARAQYIELDKEYQEKSACYEHLFKAYRDGQAGVLAGTLEEGKPCPVCGSLTHPSPATLEGEVPTDAELKTSKKDADTARDAVEKASRKCGELGSSFDANKKNVAGELVTVSGSDVQDTDSIKIESMENLVSDCISKVRELMMDTRSKLDEADKLLNRKESIEKELPDIEKQLEEARSNESSFKEKLAADKSALEAVKKQSEELKKSFKFESKKAAEEKISELKKLAEAIQRDFDNADKELKAHSEKINLLKGQIKGLQETIDKSEKADLEKELGRKEELETTRAEQNSLFNSANLRIEANESARTGIDTKCSDHIL